MENDDLSYFGSANIKYILQETKRKLKEKRDNLKISFIGRVSNGKSSIINSILGIDLLPVSFGQTTLYSIFISGIIDNIIRVKQGKENWKIFESIDGVKNYLLEIQNENISKIEINLPTNTYKILEKCSLIDNPAIGYSDELDEYVLNQCYRSCYLYVLVIDAVASISIMEKKFLSALNKRRQISEIKILLNFTDSLKDSELQVALTHHKKSIESFFCKSDDIFIFSGYAFTENKAAKINDIQNSNDSKKDSTTVNENLFDSGMFIKNKQVIDFLQKIISDEEIEHFCKRMTYLKINDVEPYQENVQIRHNSNNRGHCSPKGHEKLSEAVLFNKNTQEITFLQNPLQKMNTFNNKEQDQNNKKSLDHMTNKRKSVQKRRTTWHVGN